MRRYHEGLWIAGWWGLWYLPYVFGVACADRFPPHWLSASAHVFRQVILREQVPWTWLPAFSRTVLATFLNNAVLYTVGFYAVVSWRTGRFWSVVLPAWGGGKRASTLLDHAPHSEWDLCFIVFTVCSAVIAAGGLATAGGIVASVIRSPAGALLWGVPHGGLELLAYGVVGRLFYPGWEAGTIPERFLRRCYWIGIGLLGASAVVETLVGAP